MFNDRRVRGAVRAGFAVALVGAAVVFVVRHRDSLSVVPTESPTELNHPGVSRRGTVEQRAAALDRSVAAADPELKSRLLERVRDEFSAVSSEDVAVVDAWRVAWGLSPFDEGERSRKIGTVGYHAERIAMVSLDCLVGLGTQRVLSGPGERAALSPSVRGV